jgi:chromosome segregation ATPase
MALGDVLSDPDSAAKAFADLEAELDKEKFAQKLAQTDIDMLTRVVNDLKITASKFTTQIPTLEDQVVDEQNEVRARELWLEHTTTKNDDYKKQNAQLTKNMKVSPPDAGQHADKVSGDYSRQCEAVDEPNSRDFDVPILPGRLGCDG